MQFGGAKFSLAASESVVIVEVSASVPKLSCPTCPESRELILVADGGEKTEAGGASGWGGYGGGVHDHRGPDADLLWPAASGLLLSL
jgi:hypothetical protein